MDTDQVQGNKEKSASVEDRLASYHTPPVEPQPAVEAEKQPEPVPSSEQKPAEEVKTPEVLQAPKDDDLSLPEEASERTKTQFEKLKSRLRETEDKLKTQPLPTSTNESSAFDMFHPQENIPVEPNGFVPQVQPPPVNMNLYPGLNPLQVQNITNQFIDKDGNVDINGLNHALTQSNQGAQQAQQRVKQLEDKLNKFEENQQVVAAHAKHPEIDPRNPLFDKNKFELVRDRLVRNMWEGKKQTLEQVADDISKTFGAKQVNQTQVASQAVNEYKQAQQNRVQGPIEMGKGEDRQQELSYDEKRKLTRKQGFESPILNERLNQYFNGKK